MFDVCVIGEGTYPHTIGGVSSWTHDHLGALPELSFSVVHLRDEDAKAPRRRYRSLPNSVLMELDLDPERDEPAAALAERLPEARVYHGLATGAAGSLASRAAAIRNRPFVLTEHGLAWQEAALGITACKPLRTHPKRANLEAVAAAVRRMAGTNYREAAAVTSVCAANSRFQRREGAPVERLHLTPNAVASGDCFGFSDQSDDSTQSVPGALRIGFVGRVVRVKDVETFVRAAAIAAASLPRAEFVVIGPLDHEPDYVARCQDLATELGLADRLCVCHEHEPGEARERLDILVLTSLSEAQPRVALEAMAAGVPVVATDVGGCGELIRGLDPADQAIGAAGILTPVRDPQATADALVALGRDPGLRARLGRAGRRRAAARYSPTHVRAGWRELYGRAVEQRS